MNLKRARYVVEKIGDRWVVRDRQTSSAHSLHQFRWQARMIARQLNGSA